MWDVRPHTKTGERVTASLHGDAAAHAAEENPFPLAVSRDVHTNYADCARFIGDFIVSKVREGAQRRACAVTLTARFAVVRESNRRVEVWRVRRVRCRRGHAHSHGDVLDAVLVAQADQR